MAVSHSDSVSCFSAETSLDSAFTVKVMLPPDSGFEERQSVSTCRASFRGCIEGFARRRSKAVALIEATAFLTFTSCMQVWGFRPAVSEYSCVSELKCTLQDPGQFAFRR